MSDDKEDLVNKNYWYWFDGKAVLVQLHEPWVGVTYPNDPVLQKDESGKAVGVVTVPFLKGICHVHPDGDDVMFVLETTDPNPNARAMAYIAIRRELVAFITHIERRLVETSA